MRLHAKTTLVAICMTAVTLLFNGCTAYIFGLSQTSAYGDLILNFESDRSQVRVGEAVHMRFTIKNAGNKPYVIESPDTPVMDINVQIPGGPAVLNWASQNPVKVSHRLEWQPGASRTIELVWTPKQEDFARNDLPAFYLSGILYENSVVVQGASVTVCTTDTCR